MYPLDMAVPNITASPGRSGGSRGPSFPKSQNGTSVSVSNGKGGTRVGPSTCPSTRSAPNLRATYSGRY
jgi:hypothetical protein